MPGHPGHQPINTIFIEQVNQEIFTGCQLGQSQEKNHSFSHFEVDHEYCGCFKIQSIRQSHFDVWEQEKRLWKCQLVSECLFSVCVVKSSNGGEGPGSLGHVHCSCPTPSISCEELCPRLSLTLWHTLKHEFISYLRNMYHCTLIFSYPLSLCFAGKF